MKMSNNKAFIMIELMVVIVIIGILAGGVLTLNYLVSRQTAAEKACIYTLRLVEKVEQRYAFEKGHHSNSLQELVDGNFLSAMPKCPSGGVYAWVSEPESSEAYQTQMVCSIHGLQETPVPPPPPPPPLTSLGSTFTEITGGMIDLIKKYYDKYGKYPRSWGDYAYTDIGLDPAEWKKAYNGIIYRPKGKRISVKPGEGYTLTVVDMKGKLLTLPSDRKWSIWYDMETAKWYFKKIARKNEVDIDSLKVKKSEPNQKPSRTLH